MSLAQHSAFFGTGRSWVLWLLGVGSPKSGPCDRIACRADLAFCHSFWEYVHIDDEEM
jgi:hypothetical protein